MVKNECASVGDTGLTPGLGRSPRGGSGNPLWYSCQDNYSPWGHKESDTSEATGRASMGTSICGDLQVSYLVPRRLKSES